MENSCNIEFKKINFKNYLEDYINRFRIAGIRGCSEFINTFNNHFNFKRKFLYKRYETYIRQKKAKLQTIFLSRNYYLNITPLFLLCLVIFEKNIFGSEFDIE